VNLGFPRGLLARLMDDLPVGGGFGITYDLFADLFPPGEDDLLPNSPSFIRRVCSGYALDLGVLRTQLV
jgi:hypothetical protein